MAVAGGDGVRELVAPPPDPAAERAPTGTGRLWRVGRHVLVLGCYLALAVWVTSGLWASPDTRALTVDPVDQSFMEWALAYGVHVVRHLGDPFYTTLVNAPVGANMMANTSMLFPGVVLAPVTLLFGPAVSFVLLETLALAGTAAAWYLVFRRRLGVSWGAAALGAGLCGFAPGMVALSNTHVHITALFLAPFIVSLVLPGDVEGWRRSVGRGALLGVLLTLQGLTGMESLLSIALGTGTFVLVYALLDVPRARRLARTFLVRAGTGLVVSVVLLGYPLWMMVAGPGHTTGTPWVISASGTDVGSWLWYGSFALAGGPERASLAYAVNPIEETGFLGIGLAALLLVLAVRLWRDRTARALVLTGLVFVVLSFGTEIVVFGVRTGIPAPWALLAKVPLLEQALPDRVALVAVTAFGALLALGVDHARRTGVRRPVRYGVLALALVPILPVPLPTQYRDPIPTFFTAGTWRAYVRPGHTMLPVPMLRSVDRRGQRWSSGTGDEIAMPGGAIMIPVDGGQANWGVPRSDLTRMLARVSTTGRKPPITAAARANSRRDLVAARTDVVVLDPHTGHTAAVRATIDAVLGHPGRYVGGVWVWRTGLA
ncbi:hypothetical protein [Actinocatenispora rupis]|uniref:Glycosyl transferase n=1 Tax=Actinocatenispora rupis TaxID=519421 RepID=A0A8J3J2B1_9ACTN|nr:hypothetical protein [Actinocatenispora rupis]GID10697.1 glycosyl transferase [Actinocatenispora rupis]